MASAPEVLFHRNIRTKYPGGCADLASVTLLERFSLSPTALSVLQFVRDSLNLALSNARVDPLHNACGVWHFDYIDADESSAESFTGDGHSFIGVTIPMANTVLGLASRLRVSPHVWNALGLTPTARSENSFQFLVAFLAMMSITTHEYCHHVLGHQPEAISSGDARTASLRGNLQAQTRELAADGYAAMYMLEHLLSGAFRATIVTMLGLESDRESAQDRILFLFVLMAVAATWYRHPPAVLDEETVYLLTHPPRAVRLSTLRNWRPNTACTRRRSANCEAPLVMR